MTSAPHLVCLGLGYTATVLARRMSERGFAVTGTTRNVGAKRAALGSGCDQWHLIEWDGVATLPAEVLANATHLLHSIMPGPGGDPALASARTSASLPWIGYLSTIGVYGDHHGAWVDEDTLCRPGKARTVRRREAEEAWRSLGAHVFRLAGIYGPGRSALDRVAAGAAAIDKPGKLFNRIHVDDIATVIAASIDSPNPGRIYDVADGQPASQVEVFGCAAELLGRPSPTVVPFEEAALTPMARSFWDDDLRIRARRIRDELGVELACPDYRAGLRRCLDADQNNAKNAPM